MAEYLRDDEFGRWVEMPSEVEGETVMTYVPEYAPPVIVTRHAATVEWLRAQGVEGEVIAHVTDPEQIRGRVVIGNLPLYLAAEAEAVGAVEFTALAPELRGQELSVAEMETAGAALRWYAVGAARSLRNASYLRGAMRC